MVIYTVYELHEDLSPTGKPYIGYTKHLENRRYGHKYRLGLNYKPILHPIKTFEIKKDAFKFEQNKRIENGWKHEKHAGGKLMGYIRGKANVDSGHLQSIKSKGGSTSANIERTCPHCGKTGKGNIFKSRHIDRQLCKTK